MKLEIGGGNMNMFSKRAGWLTIDLDPNSSPDILAKVPPLPDEVMSYRGMFLKVRMIHVWEHFYLWEAEQLGREIFEILAPGGELIMELPDIEKAARFLLKQADPGRVKEHKLTYHAFYGGQDVYPGSVPMAHKYGYTPESIRAQLENIGFVVEILPAETHRPQRDMKVVARKPNGTE